jgi:hypothetical protein
MFDKAIIKPTSPDEMHSIVLIVKGTPTAIIRLEDFHQITALLRTLDAVVLSEDSTKLYCIRCNESEYVLDGEGVDAARYILNYWMTQALTAAQ